MARIKGPRKVHRYSAEFKLKAVKLSALGGVWVQEVAEALKSGQHPSLRSPLSLISLGGIRTLSDTEANHAH